jgi:hypothetical protein
VNPTICPPEQWARPTEPFITEIRSRPYVTIINRAPDDAGGEWRTAAPAERH